MVTIFSDGTISVGQTITGYCVAQTSAGTRVLAWHNNGRARPRDLGAEMQLPRRRYTLSSPQGLAQFAEDFIRLWEGA